MQGLTDKDNIGRPRVWDGKDDGFPTFAFKFQNWMSGFPGEVNVLLDRSLVVKAVVYEEMVPRIKIMSKITHLMMNRIVKLRIKKIKIKMRKQVLNLIVIIISMNLD